jgi:hypothetical protein
MIFYIYKYIFLYIYGNINYEKTNIKKYSTG